MYSLIEKASNYLYELEKLHQKRVAIYYMLIAQLCFTFMYSLIGYLRTEYTTLQILYIRMAMGFIINYKFCDIKKLELYVVDKKAFFFLILRGVFGALGMILMFISLGMMNISDSVVIQNLSPIWTNILAIFYLGEHFSKKTIVCFMFGFCGIVLMSRPDFIFHDSNDASQMEKQHTQFVGTIFGLFGSISVAVMTIIIKKLTTVFNCHNAVQQQYSYMTTFITTGILIVFYNQGDYDIINTKFLILTFLLASIGLMGQLLFSRAYGLEKTSIIAPITYIQSFLTFLADLFLFGSHIQMTSIFGSILIICGSLGVIL